MTKLQSYIDDMKEDVRVSTLHADEIQGKHGDEDDDHDKEEEDDDEGGNAEDDDDDEIEDGHVDKDKIKFEIFKGLLMSLFNVDIDNMRYTSSRVTFIQLWVICYY